MDSTKLLQSSQRWLAAGLSSFLRDGGPNDFSAHHAGVATEHLLKAYLVSLHPALVADVSHWDSLLHAVGLGNCADIPSSRTKTIGLKLAFARVRKLLPGKITITDREFEALLSARNGVAHAANYDDTETRSVLTTCVRIATVILAELKGCPEDYWGDYAHLRDQIVDQHITDLRLNYTAKITNAKETYRDRRNLRSWWSPGSAAPGPPSPLECGSIFHRQLNICPACNNPGWLEGEMLTEMWRDEIRDTFIPVDMLYPHGFQCALCGLSLEGPELEPAGLSGPVKAEMPEYGYE